MSGDRDERNNGLSHLDERGRAKMVDVGGKEVTEREAVAEVQVSLSTGTLDMILEGEVPKGDVFSTARIAGIAAAKRTPELIPLCHPLRITSVDVDVDHDIEESVICVTCTVKALDRTGVEMEALTGAAVTALTIYDMCKAVERSMEIGPIRLLSKSGGTSGTWRREEGE